MIKLSPAQHCNVRDEGGGANWSKGYVDVDTVESGPFRWGEAAAELVGIFRSETLGDSPEEIEAHFL